MALVLPGLMASTSQSRCEEMSVENICFKLDETCLGRAVELAEFTFYSIFGAVRVFHLDLIKMELVKSRGKVFLYLEQAS